MTVPNLFNPVAYRNTIILDELTFNPGDTQSQIFNATNTHLGQCALRRLVAPVGWTTCDVTLLTVDAFPSATLTSTVNLSDGSSQAVYLMPSFSAGQSISILPYGTDSIGNFIVVCSVAQGELVKLGVVLEPIYQGTA